MQTNNQIIIEINQLPYYRQLCRKIARPDLADDLYQEFIFSLLSYDNLPEVYQKEWFRQFAKKIINNLYHSQTSTFYQKYRHIDKTIKYFPGIPKAWEEKPDILQEQPDDIIKCIEVELNKMDWYDRELFKAAIKLESTRKLALKTKINRKSITATLKKVKDKIRNSPQCREFLYR